MSFLLPGSVSELARLVGGREADDGPLLPTGRPEAPAAARDALSAEGAAGLSLAGLREVVDYRPRDLTVTLEAGLSVSDLLRRLRDDGHWLPAGGPARRLSAGGWVAAAPAGPWDEAFGPVRRQLLACGVTGWDGTTVRWGRAVMKDVAGYDLPALMCGSFGRLGILHRVTFRLWPRPEAARAVVLRDGSDALEAAKALASEERLAGTPDAVTWHGGPDASGRVEVRLVGPAASVEAREAAVTEWAAGRSLATDARDLALVAPSPGPEDRPLEESVVAATGSRGGFVGRARRARSALEGALREAEGYPRRGVLRVRYARRAERPEEARAGHDEPSTRERSPLGRLLEALPEADVRVERGSARELAAVEARRSREVRRLEGRVVDALAGRPRHWLSSYL